MLKVHWQVLLKLTPVGEGRKHSRAEGESAIDAVTTKAWSAPWGALELEEARLDTLVLFSHW